MIEGYFGDGGQLFFEIDLINADGLNLPVEIMLDTGFTGFLAINKQDLEGLYWQFLRKKVVGIFAFGGEFSSWYFDFGIITISLLSS